METPRFLLLLLLLEHTQATCIASRSELLPSIWTKTGIDVGFNVTVGKSFLLVQLNPQTVKLDGATLKECVSNTKYADCYDVNFQFAFYTNWTSKPRVLEVEGEDSTKLQVGFCSCSHETAASFITCESEETINRSLTLEFDAGFLTQTATHGKCGASNGFKNCYLEEVHSNVILIIGKISQYTRVKFDCKYQNDWQIYEMQQLTDIFHKINGYLPTADLIEFHKLPLNVAPTKMILTKTNNEEVEVPATNDCPVTGNIAKSCLRIVAEHFMTFFNGYVTSKPSVLTLEGKSNATLHMGFNGCSASSRITEPPADTSERPNVTVDPPCAADSITLSAALTLANLALVYFVQ